MILLIAANASVEMPIRLGVLPGRLAFQFLHAARHTTIAVIA